MCKCKGESLKDLIPKSTSKDDRFICIAGWDLGKVIDWEDNVLCDEKGCPFPIKFSSTSKWIFINK